MNMAVGYNNRNENISCKKVILFFFICRFDIASSFTTFSLNHRPNIQSIISSQSVGKATIQFSLFNTMESTMASDDIIIDTPEEVEFKKRTKLLCEERNIPFEQIKNARDLSSTNNSPIKPGAAIRMGKVSSATDKDIEILFHDLNVKTLVDLRSPTELKEDPSLNTDKIFKDFTSLLWKERDGSIIELGEEGWHAGKIKNEHKSTEYVSKGGKERHFISIMNEFKYVKGTLSKLRKRDIAKAIIQSPGAIVSKTIRFKVKDVFLSEINSGGLPMLNELLLRMGAPGIKRVLHLISDESRHPICFYCTAGKDRTGVIAAIILAAMGAEDDDIVEDYSLSANVYAEINDHTAMVGALSQRNLNPKTFLGAPPQVMKDTMKAIKENYGSVEGYLDFIGFGEEDRQKLRDALKK